LSGKGDTEMSKTPLTKAEQATLRRLNKKVLSGKASRAEVIKAIDLKRCPGAAEALRVGQ
jgi:hypothetical protein